MAPALVVLKHSSQVVKRVEARLAAAAPAVDLFRFQQRYCGAVDSSHRAHATVHGWSCPDHPIQLQQLRIARAVTAQTTQDCGGGPVCWQDIARR